jgi:hypothetical protein
MDADEREICLYLKSWGGQFVSTREISRRAGGKWRFRQDPRWADSAISRLVERNYLESDSTGHYRLRRKQRTRAPGKFVSPEVKRILLRSTTDFSQVIVIEEEEEYYADAELKV